ncbi:MAG: PA4642 family protein [Pseudomonadales bacterium]|nr:PA4642 family protein [Pseudomonadales bacterium]
MAGPSQPSVTDEVWDDERIKSFLEMEPSAGLSADFHVLQKAYRGMRPDDFERFLTFYIEAGRDVDATDPDGRTLWEIIAKHRQGQEFVAIKEKLTA